jgi:hypothetical protein
MTLLYVFYARPYEQASKNTSDSVARHLPPDQAHER